MKGYESKAKVVFPSIALNRAQGAACLFAGWLALAAVGCGGAPAVTTGGWDGATETGSAEASPDATPEGARVADGGPDGPSDSTAEAGDESPDDAPASATCSTPQTMCAGMCTNTSADLANCGACANACASNQVCAAGTCATTCGALTTCAPDGGATYCANTASDNDNCGTCGNACGAGHVCSAGTCALTCGSLTTCAPDGGAPYCANTASDNDNCGTCSNACGAGHVCSAGTCALTCGSLTTCAPQGAAPYCTDTEFDPKNCGGCGNTCVYPNATSACSTGCFVGPCIPPFMNCDGMENNGCESNANVDPNNCGGCGVACGAGEICSAGACITQACGSAPENGSTTLTCPAGSVISGLPYASYGTPTGSCPGPFTDGACNGTNSLSVLEGLCLGLNSCTFTADNATFTDPCFGTVKNLGVIASCTPLFGATCPTGTVYTESWAEDPFASGQWTNIVGTENYNGASVPPSESLSSGGPNTQMWIGTRPSWTNYTISVPIRLDTPGGNGGLNFRMQSVGQGNDSGQMYYAGIDANEVILGMESNGWTQFGASPATFAQGTFYTLQVVLAGSTLSVSVNGGNTIVYTDSTFAFGSFGLRTFVVGMTYGPISVTCD